MSKDILTNKYPENTKNEPEMPRRSFGKTVVAAAIGAAAVGYPLCEGVRMTVFPTTQEGLSGKFYTITTVDQVEETPKKFTIIDDQVDAWMVSPNQQIGSIFLRRSGNTIRAFSTVCPHMGCAITAGKLKNPKTGVEEMLFFCPCHTEFFDIEGGRLGNTSPRNMDELKVEIEGDKVKVMYETFKPGTATV